MNRIELIQQERKVMKQILAERQRQRRAEYYKTVRARNAQ